MRSCCAQARLHCFIINNFGSYDNFIAQVSIPLAHTSYCRRCLIESFLSRLKHYNINCPLRGYFSFWGASAFIDLLHEVRNIEFLYDKHMRRRMDEMFIILVDSGKEIPTCSISCSSFLPSFSKVRLLPLPVL